MTRKTPEITKPIDPREVLKAQVKINDITAGNLIQETDWIDQISPEEAENLINAMADIRKAAGFG